MKPYTLACPSRRGLSSLSVNLLFPQSSQGVVGWVAGYISGFFRLQWFMKHFIISCYMNE